MNTYQSWLGLYIIVHIMDMVKHEVIYQKEKTI
jgi:hypothetical protein